MTNLFQAIFTVIVTLTITLTNGVVVTKPGNPTWEDNNFRFPSTHFVPSNLKITEVNYDNLLTHLADQFPVDTVNIKATGYFPKGVWMETNVFHYLRNNYGGLNLFHNGYTYRREAAFKHSTNWVCSRGRFNGKHCSASFRFSQSEQDLGIESAVTEFTSASRSVPRNLVVITDGASSSPSLTVAEINKAINMGVRTFSVGIGNNVNEQELRNIAGGNNNRVFTTSSFDKLAELLRAISIAAC